MPLIESPDPADAFSFEDVQTEYLIFFSSRDEDGKPWCPDCREVEDLVKQAFGPDGPSGTIVYVGQRPEWKAASNPFRAQPWNVESIPTAIRIADRERLVLKEIPERLVQFIVRVSK